MAVDTHIKPSPRARKLHHEMVMHATNKPKTGIRLSLEQTLKLSVKRVRAGHDDAQEIHELRSEGWIEPAPDGGWVLD